jgi:hypothetical protein
MNACFIAAAPSGPLRLELHATGVRHAVDAALALHRCEPLLCALQAWTGLALDWRWDATACSPAAGSHACARWRLDPTLEGSLELPWALLRELPVPDTALAALHWPALPAVLAVSQLRLGAEELARLEPGGAAVLPDSLLPGWHGLLRAADEPAGRGVPVALPSPAAPRLAPRHAHRAALQCDGNDGRVACEVRLATPELPADRLAGWRDDEPLADIGPQASLWRCAGSHGSAQSLAVGRLMPWGDGWALAIETAC